MDHVGQAHDFVQILGNQQDRRAARPGLFLQADGGTLFLDEVGEMPLAMQSKLLRALQERRVRPVGADRETAFDARIVAATNRDLLTSVERGEFREDLYFRLAVIELEIPPLRARGADVLTIADGLLRDAAKRADKAIEGIDPDAATATPEPQATGTEAPSADPEAQQASQIQQDWLFELVNSGDVVVDEAYGAWNPQSGQVVPA